METSLDSLGIGKRGSRGMLYRGELTAISGVMYSTVQYSRVGVIDVRWRYFSLHGIPFTILITYELSKCVRSP